VYHPNAKLKGLGNQRLRPSGMFKPCHSKSTSSRGRPWPVFFANGAGSAGACFWRSLLLAGRRTVPWPRKRSPSLAVRSFPRNRAPVGWLPPQRGLGSSCWPGFFRPGFDQGPWPKSDDVVVTRLLPGRVQCGFPGRQAVAASRHEHRYACSCFVGADHQGLLTWPQSQSTWPGSGRSAALSHVIPGIRRHCSSFRPSVQRGHLLEAAWLRSEAISVG